MKVGVDSGIEKENHLFQGIHEVEFILLNFKDDRKGKKLKVNGIGYIFFKLTVKKKQQDDQIRLVTNTLKKGLLIEKKYLVIKLSKNERFVQSLLKVFNKVLNHESLLCS